MHRRVDDLEIARVHGGNQSRRLGHVSIDDVFTDHPVARIQRDVAGRRGCGDPFGDLRVGWRHKLDSLPEFVRTAPAQIHLVPVIARRVVGGGHHNTRIGTQVLDGVGKQGCGKLAGHDECPDAGRCGDRRRVLGELARMVAGIIPNHEEGIAAHFIEQVAHEACSGPPHHRAIHAVGSGRHLPAQPRRTKLQRPGKTVR